MINNLQTLRGIAALMIFAHHFGFQSAVTESFGDCAVAIFMMLSGFVLTLALLKRNECSKPLPLFYKFISKRLIRIYPLYLLGQLSMFALLKFDIGPAKALADLLMIQSWIPSADYYFSGNAPSWFVSDLIFCYLLFLPTIKLFSEKRRATTTAAIALGLSAYFICIIFLPENLVHPIIYIFPPMQFPAFALGILCAQIIGTTRHVTKSPIAGNILTLSSIVLLILQIYLYPAVSPRLTLSSYWWPAAFALIFMLTRYDKTKCVVTTVLHTPLLVKLGDISYALYIFHLPFLYVWRHCLQHFGIELPIGWDFALAGITLTGISYLIHRLCEIPATKALDSLAARLEK